MVRWLYLHQHIYSLKVIFMWSRGDNSVWLIVKFWLHDLHSVYGLGEITLIKKNEKISELTIHSNCGYNCNVLMHGKEKYIPVILSNNVSHLYQHMQLLYYQDKSLYLCNNLKDDKSPITEWYINIYQLVWFLCKGNICIWMFFKASLWKSN